MTTVKKLFLSLLMVSAAIIFSHPTKACAEHDNQTDAQHIDDTHFTVTTPTSAGEAWILLDQSIIKAREGIKAKNSKAVHETGDELFVAVTALHDDPLAVKEEDGGKLSTSLDDLVKMASKFHQAAEKDDLIDATKILDALEEQKASTRLIYPEFFQVEP